MTLGILVESNVAAPFWAALQGRAIAKGSGVVDPYFGNVAGLWKFGAVWHPARAGLCGLCSHGCIPAPVR